MIWKSKIKKRVETRSAAEPGIIEFINLDRYSNPQSNQNAGKPDFLVPSKIMLPQWYKDLPIMDTLREGDDYQDLTIKRCIPILDAMTTGYHLVTTTDYYFEYDAEKGDGGSFKGREDIISQKPITMHPTSQISTLRPSPEFINYAYKWANTWVIKTPPGYSCIFTNPLFSVESPFYTLDGVVDTDNYFMPVLFPFLMKNNFNGLIPAGTPVVQIIPFKRDDWTMKINDKFSQELFETYESEKQLYEAQRYGKDHAKNGVTDVLGGMYKRDYRVKKKYT